MKIFTGKVISKKMQKTATVAVERIVAHPIYKKRIKKIKKYQVHDELEIKVGQVVKFIASKPFSKTKKWIVIDISGDEKSTRKTGKKANKKNTKQAKKKVAKNK
jgi:small subunit ribosomal protein S17